MGTEGKCSRNEIIHYFKESKKFEAEFEEYQEKLKLQKDQWAKENPDKVSVCVIGRAERSVMVAT